MDNHRQLESNNIHQWHKQNYQMQEIVIYLLV